MRRRHVSGRGVKDDPRWCVPGEEECIHGVGNEAGQNAAVSGVVCKTEPASTKKPLGHPEGLVSFAFAGFTPKIMFVQKLASGCVKIDE